MSSLCTTYAHANRDTIVPLGIPPYISRTYNTGSYAIVLQVPSSIKSGVKKLQLCRFNTEPAVHRIPSNVVVTKTGGLRVSSKCDDWGRRNRTVFSGKSSTQDRMLEERNGTRVGVASPSAVDD